MHVLEGEVVADELVRGLDLGRGLGQLLDGVRADAGHLLEVAGDGRAEPGGELVRGDLGLKWEMGSGV